MIVVRYTAADPRGQANWFQHELRSDDLVLIRECHTGGIVDETLVPEQADGWSGIRYLLDGPVVARAPGRCVELRQGDAFASSTVGTAPVRSLTMTTDVLHILWRRDSSVGRSISSSAKLRFSPLTDASLRRVVAALAADDRNAPCPSTTVHEVLVALRAEGLPVTPPTVDWAHPTALEDHAVAHAIERVAFPLSSRPMSVDLARELGVGEHHALRRANQYFRRFHLCARSWREYLRGQRVALGAFFMGRPEARTDRVARLLGFQSPTSFCHAFLAAGLASPREVQRELLA
ncbi:MAG: helix-turn-helix transcriptional regulator [Planctomycetales bacterium]|nr:helix-turn-helix transcriptional regulator [Planctomycetales bacterium]